nr:ATP synthase F0 subunit 8 [Strongylocotes lipogonus]
MPQIMPMWWLVIFVFSVSVYVVLMVSSSFSVIFFPKPKSECLPSQDELKSFLK